ncbi:hypothetical protein BCF53_11272 [Reinekea marinisedimentorum]|uniref:Uncharacterized protein n=1 Tax=Reinekea marinisedimentorum TaxID=230495 RepID=A0A4R3I211_9GAMM|nr:hypothetical protein BCF53_11272 [Reinekea marinisedimentorum]
MLADSLWNRKAKGSTMEFQKMYKKVLEFSIRNGYGNSTD